MMPGTSDNACAADDWHECPDCGAPFALREIAPGYQLKCSRCGARLAQGRRGNSLQAPLALAICGLVLLGMANVFPIMTFDVAGRTQSNLIVTGIWGLVDQGYGPLAALVFFCSIAAPGIYLLVLTYALAGTVSGGGWPLLGVAWRWAETVEPWSLVPVYAVACLVAVVRLRLLGSVDWDDGAYFTVLLAFCCLALGRMLDRERIDFLREGAA